MSTNKELKSRKSVQTTTETVTESQITKSSIYAYTIVLLGLFTPFLHIFLPINLEGIFGFPYMSSFLVALSYPLLAISGGLLLQIASKHLKDGIEKPIKRASIVFTSVGVFFLIYTFYPMPDMPYWTYFLVLLLTSIPMGFAMYRLNEYIFLAELKLKANLKIAFSFIINDGEKHATNKEQYHQDYEIKVIDRMNI